METKKNDDGPRVDYWAPEDTETLFYTDFDEAVFDELENSWPDLPESLVMIGYIRTEATLDSAAVLDQVLERLDEVYGDLENFSEPTPKMLEAAKVFAAVVLAEYHSHRCEEVTRETIGVVDWCKHNAADLLEKT